MSFPQVGENGLQKVVELRYNGSVQINKGEHQLVLYFVRLIGLNYYGYNGHHELVPLPVRARRLIDLIGLDTPIRGVHYALGEKYFDKMREGDHVNNN